MVRAADERQAALEGCSPVEAEIDRLRARVRTLEAELLAVETGFSLSRAAVRDLEDDVAALTKTRADLLAALALRSSQVLPHGRTQPKP